MIESVCPWMCVCVRAIRTTHVSRWLLATAGDPGRSTDDDQKSDTFTCSSSIAHSPFSPCHTFSQTAELHTLVNTLSSVVSESDKDFILPWVVYINDHTLRIITLSEKKITLVFFYVCDKIVVTLQRFQMECFIAVNPKDKMIFDYFSPLIQFQNRLGTVTISRYRFTSVHL